MIDDRDLRPGVKFADADLIGIPYHVVVGAKGLKDGNVEIKERKTGKVEKIKPDEVYERIKK
jgi:prolyl-tRNA synthetase